MNVCSYCGLVSMFASSHNCTGVVASIDDARTLSADHAVTTLNAENRALTAEVARLTEDLANARDWQAWDDMTAELDTLRAKFDASQTALAVAIQRLQQHQALT